MAFVHLSTYLLFIVIVAEIVYSGKIYLCDHMSEPSLAFIFGVSFLTVARLFHLSFLGWCSLNMNSFQFARNGVSTSLWLDCFILVS